MKQILQHLGNGTTWVESVPTPGSQPGRVLIQTNKSLISAGTERMLLEFGKGNLLSKARQQPEKVKQTLQKISTDGLVPTFNAVTSKLNQPIPLGYCNVGTVLETSCGFKQGDRVLSNGHHAEVVNVPKNLIARIPDEVDDSTAAYGVLAAIALQGVRLANPTIGERFVVVGLGLIGLLTVQILIANGCRVLAIDMNDERIELAKSFGAETFNSSGRASPVSTALTYSEGMGVDGVLLAVASSSNKIISEAATMCRKRGRIVLVGVTGLELNRSDFFEKELTFQVSCSYGPGRYDPTYEEGGNDYPPGFVRWTEQRNFEAVLDLMRSGKIQTDKFTSHTFEIGEAEKAYSLLSEEASSLGILLDYPESEAIHSRKVQISEDHQSNKSAGNVVAGFIGAGNYGGRVLMAGFKKAGAQMHSVVSAGGVSAIHQGRQHGVLNASSDTADILSNEDINSVIISTRHNSHSEFVVQSIESGKNVFVEKPLCLSLEELSDIKTATENNPDPILMVGFNRRFAPMIVNIKNTLSEIKTPKSMIMTVNAGAIPADHWLQDAKIGGGRIVGEACHFIDLLRHLVGVPVTNTNVTSMRVPGQQHPTDSASTHLEFEDGSIGTVHYLANGEKGYPKEKLEIFVDGSIIALDNFRRMTVHGKLPLKSSKLFRQDKGQNHCIHAFVEAIRSGGASPIPLDELFEVAEITIKAAESID